MSEIPLDAAVMAALAGTPCVIVGHPTAGGVYDDKGNCIVPFQFTRPDGLSLFDCSDPVMGRFPCYFGPSWEQRKMLPIPEKLK